MKRTWLVLVLLVQTVGFVACGDSGSNNTMPTPTAPVVPAASIAAVGNGAILVHPSALPSHIAAIEFPLRITESGGGSAIWNFFRTSYFLAGVEVERAELGSGVIRDGGFRDIAANSTTNVSVVTRVNGTDFDTIVVTLGFADTRDGRTFRSHGAVRLFHGRPHRSDPGGSSQRRRAVMPN